MDLDNIHTATDKLKAVNSAPTLAELKNITQAELTKISNKATTEKKLMNEKITAAEKIIKDPKSSLEDTQSAQMDLGSAKAFLEVITSFEGALGTYEKNHLVNVQKAQNLASNASDILKNDMPDYYSRKKGGFFDEVNSSDETTTGNVTPIATVSADSSLTYGSGKEGSTDSTTIINRPPTEKKKFADNGVKKPKIGAQANKAATAPAEKSHLTPQELERNATKEAFDRLSPNQKLVQKYEQVLADLRANPVNFKGGNYSEVQAYNEKIRIGGQNLQTAQKLVKNDNEIATYQKSLKIEPTSKHYAWPRHDDRQEKIDELTANNKAIIAKLEASDHTTKLAAKKTDAKTS